jgi:hypothetical protein
MTAARTFVRLAIAGFIVNALVMACVVKSDTTNAAVSCNPGDKKDCSCSDSSTGQKTCNSSGDGYSSCACQNGGGGSGNAGGDGTTTTAGTKPYGGSTSYAGQNYGGVPTGGAPDMTPGGAGGAPNVTPLECQSPADDCEACYFSGCCDQYAPCVNDPKNVCLSELAQVLACTDQIKMTRSVKTSDLESCAQQAGSTQGSWSASLSPLTVDVINCIAGEPGWEGKAWGPLACKASCFDK